MYNIIKYSDNYWKTYWSLYQFCRNGPKSIVTDSESFKFKSRFLTKTNDIGTINVEIAVPLKYLNNFWKAFEMPVTSFEVNLILTWSTNSVISEGNRETTFAITDMKLYVLAVTLSTQYNENLSQQLTPVFKRTINWNKYQSKVKCRHKNNISYT